MRFVVINAWFISVCTDSEISYRFYDLNSLDLNAELEGAEVVVVQGWDSPQLVAAVGRHRVGSGNYWLFFQDADVRAPGSTPMAARYLRFYDGAVVSNEDVRDEYLRWRWARRVWTLHEAFGPELLAMSGSAEMCASLRDVAEQTTKMEQVA